MQFLGVKWGKIDKIALILQRMSTFLSLVSLKHLVRSFYHCYASNREERLRLTIFLLGVFMVLGTMPLQFFNIMGSPHPFFQGVTAVFILLTLTGLALLLMHVINITQTLNITCIGCQILQSIRIVILTLHPELASYDVMMLNLVADYIILLQLIMASIPKSPVIVTAIQLPTLAFAHFYPPPGQALCSTQIWLLFTVVSTLSCVMSVFTQTALTRLQEERTEYKTIQDSFLSAFGITKSELVTFLQVWKGNTENDERLVHFLDGLDITAQARLIKAAKFVEAEHKGDCEKIAEHFPNLTKTELNVAALIIKGKTKHEIAEMLEKTDNNIGTVRINIRRKLQLSSDIDLREYLLSQENGQKPKPNYNP